MARAVHSIAVRDVVSVDTESATRPVVTAPAKTTGGLAISVMVSGQVMINRSRDTFDGHVWCAGVMDM